MKFVQASLLTVFTGWWWLWWFAPTTTSAFHNNNINNVSSRRTPRRQQVTTTAAGSAGSDRLRPWARAKLLGESAEAGRNIYPNKRWKERVGDVVIIPYQIVGTRFSANQKRMINDAVQQFSDAVKVIKFVERTTQLAYIRVEYNPGGGCSSEVGRLPTGKSQNILLGGSCFVDDSGASVLGRIQHEFMHALGFEHEHVSTC